MGITVGHDPNLQVTGAAAFAVGDPQRDQLRLEAARMAQDNQHFYAQQDQQAALAQQAQQAAALQGYYQRNQQAGQDVFEAGVQQQRDAARFQNEGDLSNQQYQQRLSEGQQQTQNQDQAYDFRLTDAQNQALAKSYNDEHEVNMAQADGTMRPEEAEYAINQIRAKRAGIKPMPTIPNKQATIQEELQRRQWTDPQTGDTYLMQPDGKLTPRPSTVPKMEAVKQKAMAAAENARIKNLDRQSRVYTETIKALITQDKDGGRVMPSDEEVTKHVKKAMGKYYIPPDDEDQPQDQPAAQPQQPPSSWDGAINGDPGQGQLSEQPLPHGDLPFGADPSQAPQQQQAPAAQPAPQMPRFTSVQQANEGVSRLPRGTVFIGPDGKPHRKK